MTSTAHRPLLSTFIAAVALTTGGAATAQVDDWSDTHRSADASGAVSLDYGAYYDGYYDGFHDERFGFDFIDVDRTDRYAESYRDGYYDGFYDQTREYDFEPFYYVFGGELDGTEAGRRRYDDSRRAGDRMAAFGTSEEEFRERRQMWNDRDIARLRGDIASIDRVRLSGRHDEHVTVGVRFADGRTQVFDLGGQVVGVPFDVGDRATFQGRVREIDGREVFTVNRVSVDGHRTRVRAEDDRTEDDRTDDDRTDDDRDDDRSEWRWPWEDDDDRAELVEGERRNLQGVVRDWRALGREPVEGHELYRLTLRDGRVRLIDFGDDIDGDRVRLDSGDLIWIRGTRHWDDGRRVIRATRIRVNGAGVLR